MARIRSIHPDACDSEKLAELSSDAERLYWRLLTHCDDDGRCDDNLKLIRGKVVPLLEWGLGDLDEILTELHDGGLLVRYVVAGRRYLQVLQWERFQHPRKPQRGKRPPVPPVDTHTDHTSSPNEDTPVAHQCDTGTDSEDASVALGEEWSGVDGRPPNGGGGSRGEGGTELRGNRPRPFNYDPAMAPHVRALQERRDRIMGTIEGGH